MVDGGGDLHDRAAALLKTPRTLATAADAALAAAMLASSSRTSAPISVPTMPIAARLSLPMASMGSSTATVDSLGVTSIASIGKSPTVDALYQMEAAENARKMLLSTTIAASMATPPMPIATQAPGASGTQPYRLIAVFTPQQQPGNIVAMQPMQPYSNVIRVPSQQPASSGANLYAKIQMPPGSTPTIGMSKLMQLRHSTQVPLGPGGATAPMPRGAHGLFPGSVMRPTSPMPVRFPLVVMGGDNSRLTSGHMTHEMVCSAGGVAPTPTASFSAISAPSSATSLAPSGPLFFTKPPMSSPFLGQSTKRRRITEPVPATGASVADIRSTKLKEAVAARRRTSTATTAIVKGKPSAVVGAPAALAVFNRQLKSFSEGITRKDVGSQEKPLERDLDEHDDDDDDDEDTHSDSSYKPRRKRRLPTEVPSKLVETEAETQKRQTLLRQRLKELPHAQLKWLLRLEATSNLKLLRYLDTLNCAIEECERKRLPGKLKRLLQRRAEAEQVVLANCTKHQDARIWDFLHPNDQKQVRLLLEKEQNGISLTDEQAEYLEQINAHVEDLGTELKEEAQLQPDEGAPTSTPNPSATPESQIGAPLKSPDINVIVTFDANSPDGKRRPRKVFLTTTDETGVFIIGTRRLSPSVTDSQLRETISALLSELTDPSAGRLVRIVESEDADAVMEAMRQVEIDHAQPLRKLIFDRSENVWGEIIDEVEKSRKQEDVDDTLKQPVRRLRMTEGRGRIDDVTIADRLECGDGKESTSKRSAAVTSETSGSPLPVRLRSSSLSLPCEAIWTLDADLHRDKKWLRSVMQKVSSRGSSSNSSSDGAGAADDVELAQSDEEEALKILKGMGALIRRSTVDCYKELKAAGKSLVGMEAQLVKAMQRVKKNRKHRRPARARRAVKKFELEE